MELWNVRINRYCGFLSDQATAAAAADNDDDDDDDHTGSLQEILPETHKGLNNPLWVSDFTEKNLLKGVLLTRHPNTSHNW